MVRGLVVSPGSCLAGHGGRVKPSPDEFRRVAQWLDLNAPFYGGYTWNKPEWRQAAPDGEAKLRAAIAKRFGPDVAKQPFAALVNVGDVEQSRILLGGLPEVSGGWGQLQPAFSGRGDEGWQSLRSLVLQSLTPLQSQDVAGTCQLPACQCRACWVPKAEAGIPSCSTGQQPLDPLSWHSACGEQPSLPSATPAMVVGKLWLI